MIATETLRSLSLLNGLDDDLLTGLAQVMRTQCYQRKEFVLHKGSSGEDLLFLIQGRLQVVDITEDGREVGLHFISPGDYFGELAIIDDQPRSAAIVASSASEVAFLPKSHALHLFYHSPSVIQKLLKSMAQTIRRASSFRSMLGSNAYQRVYMLLASYMQQSAAGLVAIENLPTQQELAIMANTSRETVSRALNELIEKGIIEKDLRRLIIRNPDALRLSALSSESGKR